MIRSFDEIFLKLKGLPKQTLAVAAASDVPVLQAVDYCRRQSLIDAILVGDEGEIRAIAEAQGLDLNGCRILHEADPAQAALRAVELVSRGEADMVMKGLIDTKKFLRALLDKAVGLRTGKLITHIGVFEIPQYDRLLYITDAAFVTYPTLLQKAVLIHNAVELAHAIGNSYPKVAVVCAVEVVNPDMPPTLDAEELTRMNQSGEISGCEVFGPLAFDNAIDREAAIHKKISHPVAGAADIFLMANIEAANAVYKVLTYACQGERHGGILMGAAAPIILTSRADSFEARVNSIALASLAAAGGFT